MIGWQPSTMPTTMLMTTVNTLLSIPITAMGMSTPVLRHGAVANQHSVALTRTMTRIVICVIKRRNPQPRAGKGAKNQEESCADAAERSWCGRNTRRR